LHSPRETLFPSILLTMVLDAIFLPQGGVVTKTKLSERTSALSRSPQLEPSTSCCFSLHEKAQTVQGDNMKKWQQLWQTQYLGYEDEYVDEFYTRLYETAPLTCPTTSPLLGSVCGFFRASMARPCTQLPRSGLGHLKSSFFRPSSAFRRPVPNHAFDASTTFLGTLCLGQKGMASPTLHNANAVQGHARSCSSVHVTDPSHPSHTTCRRNVAPVLRRGAASTLGARSIR